MNGVRSHHPNGSGSSARPSADGRGPRAVPLSLSNSNLDEVADERRRLIECCFSKTDPDGALSETYVSHLRVIEDAAHPQSPPPPNSLSQNKKHRVIVISAPSEGPIRLHKARENDNGSFSIGKTWSIEHLLAVESFTNAVASTPEQQQRKDWAGQTGLIVTLGKPYYWNARSFQQKQSFIHSLIRVCLKSKRKLPQLIGFSQKEVDMLLHQSIAQGSGDSLNHGSAPLAKLPLLRSGDLSNRRVIASQPGDLDAPRPLQPRSRPGTAGGDKDMMHTRDEQSRAEERPSGLPHTRDPTRQSSRDPRKPPLLEQLRPRPIQEQRPPFSPALSPLIPSPRLTPQLSQSELFQRHNPPSREPIPGSSHHLVHAIPGKQSEHTKSVAGRGVPLSVAPIDQRTDNPPLQGAHLATSRSNPSNNEERIERAHVETPPEREIPSAQAESGQSGSPSGSKSPRYEDIPPALRSPRPPTSTERPTANGTGCPPESYFPPTTNQTHHERAVAPEHIEDMKSNSHESVRNLGLEVVDPEAKHNLVEFSPELPPPDLGPGPKAELAATRTPLSSTGDEGQETAKLATNMGIGSMVGNTTSDLTNGRGPDSKPKMADVLRKAANAYGAFKPRAGGAAQKFKAALADAPSEQKPDGITGVFNAPSLNRQHTDDSTRAEQPRADTPGPAISEPKLQHNDAAASDAESLPGLVVSAPADDVQPTDASSGDTTVPSPVVKRGRSPEDMRREKRRHNHQARYLASLGLDAGILDSRGLEIETILSDFGCGSATLQPKRLEAFEADLKREIARVDAGSWLSNTDHNDGRVETVEKMLDRVIGECDELEGLLTLYNVELGSLNDDIAFIEAQSQGLQVQTANQKLLHSELRKLVSTISIEAGHLEPLRNGKIGKPDELEAIEKSLLLLYKAMVTIDPTVRQGVEIPDAGCGMGNGELASMRALQEKKQKYLDEAAVFLNRLGQHMDMTFGAALLNTRDAIVRQIVGSSTPTKLDPAMHNVARNALWQYSPLLLFAKEIDVQTWDNLLKMYQARARVVYQEEFRDNVTAWKKLARRPTGEEQDLLFTSQEKDNETLKTTARKLTVKRSGTLARGLRSSSGEKTDKGGRLHPYEAFAGTLDEMAPLVFTEQNFVVEFFHASSTENADFADVIGVAPPLARKGSNLLARKVIEPDRAMAKRVVEVMDGVFSFWPTELQNLVEFAVNSDPLQGVGILACLDRVLREYEDTNQEFLNRTLQALQTRLAGLFNRFVDEQITAIEETKVKIKKRKGVIFFFKTFPHFSGAIENMIPTAEDLERLDVRLMVDDAYQKINKAMFESLKVIAKESPAATAVQGVSVGSVGADPEDKEALNYHILHIENMNHYIEEVESHREAVLLDWKDKARAEMDEHMGLYIDAVIRRPLGKLLDFLEPLPAILAALSPGTPPSAIANRPSHSRAVFKKVAASHDSKEARKGIEALRKRVDKHFGDADDPGLSRNLVAKVLGECERKYQDVWQRLIQVNNDIYGGEVDIGSWGDEVAGSFKGR